MIRYYKQEKRAILEVDKISNASWVNIYPPFEHGELESFAKVHKIPFDFLTDSLDIDERSRYEREDDVDLILVNTPILNEDTRESEAIYITVPVGVVLVKNILITITSKENPIIEQFLNGKVKNFKPENRRLFVLQIFGRNVQSFLECLKKLNLKRNLIEQELYNSSRNAELRQLLRIEKSLVYFVNSLSTNELLKMKMKRTDFLKISDNEILTDVFEDIIIDNTQALEMSNVYTNILSSTMEAYASIISNNMNLFIHRLTIVTIILMVPTVVASFYGMNLDYLPLSKSRFAFPTIIFVSVFIGFGLIWFFRKKKHF